MLTFPYNQHKQFDTNLLDQRYTRGGAMMSASCHLSPTEEEQGGGNAK